MLNAKTFANMGFNHGIGMYARGGRLKDGTEKVAVKFPGGRGGDFGRLQTNSSFQAVSGFGMVRGQP